MFEKCTKGQDKELPSSLLGSQKLVLSNKTNRSHPKNVFFESKWITKRQYNTIVKKLGIVIERVV